MIALVNIHEHIKYMEGNIEQQINDVIDDAIEYIKINNADDLLLLISKELGCEKIKTTYTCHTTLSSVFQIIFNEHEEGEEENKLCTQLCNGIKATNKCIITKTNNNNIIENINRNDIFEIFKIKFVKKGISLTTDGIATEFIYNRYPYEKYESIKPEQFAMNFNIEKQQYLIAFCFGGNTINKNGSKIFQKNIYGDILIVLVQYDDMINDKYYIDFDINKYEKCI